MEKLISADRLRRQIETTPLLLGCPEFIRESLLDLIDIQDEAVTHCEDCKHNKKRLKYGPEMCRVFDVPMDKEDFCSYGKRRE